MVTGGGAIRDSEMNPWEGEKMMKAEEKDVRKSVRKEKN